MNWSFKCFANHQHNVPWIQIIFLFHKESFVVFSSLIQSCIFSTNVCSSEVPPRSAVTKAPEIWRIYLNRRHCSFSSLNIILHWYNEFLKDTWSRYTRNSYPCRIFFKFLLVQYEIISIYVSRNSWQIF